MPVARDGLTSQLAAAESMFDEMGLQLCERVFWAWEAFANS
jgi:hypothetical protein